MKAFPHSLHLHGFLSSVNSHMNFKGCRIISHTPYIHNFSLRCDFVHVHHSLWSEQKLSHVTSIQSVSPHSELPFVPEEKADAQRLPAFSATLVLASTAFSQTDGFSH